MLATVKDTLSTQNYSLLLRKLNLNKSKPDGGPRLSFPDIYSRSPLDTLIGRRECKRESWQNMAHNIPQTVHIWWHQRRNIYLKMKGSAAFLECVGGIMKFVRRWTAKNCSFARIDEFRDVHECCDTNLSLKHLFASLNWDKWSLKHCKQDLLMNPWISQYFACNIFLTSLMNVTIKHAKLSMRQRHIPSLINRSLPGCSRGKREKLGISF